MSTQSTKALFYELMYRAGYERLEELAEAVCIPAPTMRGWVDGFRQPRYRADAEAVADALYTDVETLFPKWVPYALRSGKSEGSAMLRAMYAAGYDNMEEFANALGATRDSVKRWAHEENAPLPIMAYRISGLLHVAPSDLWPKFDGYESPLMEAMAENGYESISAFCKVANVPEQTLVSWTTRNTKPRREVAERCAKILGSSLKKLFPDHNWADKEIPRKKKAEEYWEPEGFKPLRRNADPVDYADLGGDAMSEIRRKADVWVGRKFVITTHHKDGTLRRPAVVEECQDRWFRVRYAKGYCECFSYHSRLHDSECKCFRNPEKEHSAKPLSAAGR